MTKAQWFGLAVGIVGIVGVTFILAVSIGC